MTHVPSSRPGPLALLILADARNAFELSALVGDAPDYCQSEIGEQVHCLWRTTAATYGHGTLAMTIGAPFRKKVRLSCRLPVQGSPRGAKSCVVTIGSRAETGSWKTGDTRERSPLRPLLTGARPVVHAFRCRR